MAYFQPLSESQRTKHTSAALSRPALTTMMTAAPARRQA